ncbi:MAG: ribulose-phosphate 3-epimerase [Candidatus Cloacimonetes bacterium]|nr:ribulose-phosphate 3-epimerase [Candidatus Cloacimonadota bacterium]
MSKIQIAPSILSADFGILKQEIEALEAAQADIIHLDLMDGHYVPNLSFGFPLISKIRELTSLPLDAHLMVTNPAFYIDELAKIGVQMVSFHQETEYHSHRMVQHIHELGMQAGIALNPATPLSSLDEILPELDFVLIMSVNPGYSGQSFICSNLDKIQRLSATIRSRILSIQIEVDGGVKESNAKEIVSSGADILVSASYIFSHSSYSDAIRSLKNV